MPHAERFAKNLYLCDDKKRNRYLAVVPHDTRTNLKKLADTIGSRRLRFANEDDLEARLLVSRGSVTPLAVLNDADHQVEVIFDERFREGVVGVHPMVNTATVYVPAKALVELIRAHGNPVMFVDFASMAQRDDE